MRWMTVEECKEGLDGMFQVDPEASSIGELMVSFVDAADEPPLPDSQTIKQAADEMCMAGRLVCLNPDEANIARLQYAASMEWLGEMLEEESINQHYYDVCKGVIQAAGAV